MRAPHARIESNISTRSKHLIVFSVVAAYSIIVNSSENLLRSVSFYEFVRNGTFTIVGFADIAFRGTASVAHAPQHFEHEGSTRGLHRAEAVEVFVSVVPSASD